MKQIFSIMKKTNNKNKPNNTWIINEHMSPSIFFITFCFRSSERQCEVWEGDGVGVCWWSPGCLWRSTGRCGSTTGYGSHCYFLYNWWRTGIIHTQHNLSANCIVYNGISHTYRLMAPQILLVWWEKVEHLATDPVVQRSNPVTGHIRYDVCLLIIPN